MTTERDRVAVVTGGSYGIGRDFVAELSRRGYRTIVCARDSQKLAQLELEFPGVETIVCDMSDLDSVAHFADTILQKTPAIDLLVSNAGRASEYDLKADDLSGIDVAGEININLAGPLKLILALLPALKKRPGSGIIVVTSGYALVPYPRMPIYSATKAGLRSFTKSLRREMKPFGVHVLELAPPLVDTPAVQHKKGRKISSAEVVRQALRGLDDKREEVLPGQARLLPMLLRLAPRLTENMIAGR
jgi:uncharacterized oxidoreductase